MRTRVNADGGYARARAAGKAGWADDSEYERFKNGILASFRRSNAPKSGRLLEIGCGAGNMTLWFAQMGYEAYGVDTTPRAIEWARERNEQATTKADFRLEDAAELRSFPESHFDLVIDGRCLHWIYGEGRQRILQTVRRVLRPHGLLLVCSQCGDPKNIESPLSYDASRRVVVNRAGDICAYFGMPESISVEVKAAGFTVLSSELIAAPDGDMIHIEAIKEAE